MNMNFAYLVQTLKWVTYDKLSLVYRVYHFHPIYWLYLDFHCLLKQYLDLFTNVRSQYHTLPI